MKATGLEESDFIQQTQVTLVCYGYRFIADAKVTERQNRKERGTATVEIEGLRMTSFKCMLFQSPGSQKVPPVSWRGAAVK